MEPDGSYKPIYYFFTRTRKESFGKFRSVREEWARTWAVLLHFFPITLS